LPNRLFTIAKLFNETGLPNAVLKQGGRIFNETGLADLYEKGYPNDLMKQVSLKI
jgi:hypothetical protein